MVHEKIANVKLGRLSLIRYKFGRLKGVRFERKELGKHVKWDDYFHIQSEFEKHEKAFK